jgi:sensor histidine kinase YesM
MNKKLVVFLHVAFWAFMFLSPLTYMRGTGVTLERYLMNCMSPLLMLTVFYVNYLWLTPKYFVAGKHRYHLLINVVMVICFGFFHHYWMSYVQELLSNNPPRRFMMIDAILFLLRDIINLAIFALMATALVLAFRWQHNEDARLEAESARTKAELKNLRYQINPHFLLNTLNNIYALTAIDQTRAQDAVQQLSKLLRHLLYDQEENVNLDNEVRFLESYTNLMRLRLPPNVEVSFTYEPPEQPALVAPLLAVSLVENAFKHGISPTLPSFIRIHIFTVGRQVVCDIENSNHPKTEKDHSGHGIGLQQVQHRLDLSYPGQYEWIHGVSADGKVYKSTIKLNL